ncbi:MAG: glycoside hydrolase family 5 protein [Butyrivibrio sp.]|uniref:glycoside hydrolase family 5 protein n=1 Tax=Butyrivibrio sp. TaxID=28121 RepID=UPI0025FB2B10|nr:glycoside hydrolase family 5 protein [Butyrivibrio sp.]MCR5771113.1 glycoside hydrolase family 5 protein [Butyrivibrio sp.]
MKKKVISLLLVALLTGCGVSGSAQQKSDTSVLDASGIEVSDADSSESETSENESTAESSMEDNEMATEITIPEIEIEQKDIPDNESLSFVRDMKLGLNIGNTFDAFVDSGVNDDLTIETAWGNDKVTKEFIKAIHDNGFSTVRIPISWHNHVDENNKINEAWLDRVQEVVDYAVEEDMYVIINIHHDNHLEANGLYPDEEHKEQSLDYIESIWTQVADRFKDYDNKLIFESMNEPRLVGHNNEWWIDPNNEDCKNAIAIINELNQKFVDVVRASGGNNEDRYLMCPGYCASPDGVLNDGFVIPTDSADNKIILSIHAYTPYSFALESPGIDNFDASSAASRKDIDYFMEKIYTKYISQGIPVVIGECGCVDKNGNLQDRVDWAAYYTAKAKSCGLPLLWWDNGAFSGNGELFGFIHRDDGTLEYPDMMKAMLKYME